MRFNCVQCNVIRVICEELPKVIKFGTCCSVDLAKGALAASTSKNMECASKIKLIS